MNDLPTGKLRPVSLSDSVREELISLIVAGVLKPGDHLAPERALATELGVGRSSVREAVRVLEVLGLVRTQTGSGPSSGAVITAAPSDGMSVLMRLQVAAQGFGVDDVVRTRLLLETAVVGELAALAGPDLAEADTLLLTVPNQLGVDYNAHVLESILKHVAPALGWR